MGIGRRQFGAGVLAVALPRVARAAPTLAPPDLISAGKLVMSINPTLPPMQYVDDQGQLKGMRVDFANELCKRLGLAPEYQRVEFSVMVPGLAARRWDMINTGIYWTEDRAKLMYMVPTDRSALSFLVARNNPLGIKDWKDLSGRTVAVEIGGLEEKATRQVNDMLIAAGLKGLDAHIFNNFGEAFQALRAGQADAVTVGDTTAMFWQQRGDFTRAVSGMFPQTTAFAFASKPVALAVVDVLNGMKADGYYDKLLAQYGVLPIAEASFAIKGPGPA